MSMRCRPMPRSPAIGKRRCRRSAAALVKAVDGSGRPLGMGAAVSVEPDGSTTSIAQGGAFFVRAEPGRKRATITQHGERCIIEFELLSTDVGAYRSLGPYTCAP